jgi:hypothetical protein
MSTETSEAIFQKAVIKTLDNKSFDHYYVDFNDRCDAQLLKKKKKKKKDDDSDEEEEEEEKVDVDNNNSANNFKCIEMIYTKCAFVAVTTKGFGLKKLFNSIHSEFPKANLLFKKDGIRITEIDKHGKLLILVHLVEENFAGYYCPDDFCIPFDLEDVSNQFKGTKKVNQLSILSVSSPDRLDFYFETDPKKRRKPEDTLTTPVILRRSVDSLRIKKNKEGEGEGKGKNEDEGGEVENKFAKLSSAPEVGMSANFPFKIIIPIKDLKEMEKKLGKKLQEKKLTITVTCEFVKFSVGLKEEIYPHKPALVFDDDSDGDDITKKKYGAKRFEPQTIHLDFCYWKSILTMMEGIKTFPEARIYFCFSDQHPFILLVQEVSNLGNISYILSEVKKETCENLEQQQEKNIEMKE